MRRAVVLLLVVLFAAPSLSWAQSPNPGASIDPERMGVSLDRIRRQLAQESREVMTSDGVKLDVRIDVFGAAPPIDFIPQEFNLAFGPVPNSAPTHREHIEHVTPREFRSPALPVYSLAMWAAQKLADRSSKARCEEEVANYRALVMQGIAVAAPRCTQ